MNTDSITDLKDQTKQISHKPKWLKTQISQHQNSFQTKQIIRQHKLNTVCVSAKCPNIGECYTRGTATYMILGDICTRNCGFCSVKTGKPLPPDPNEPHEVAQAIKDMKLKYAVITSVDRDDLSDLGASIWADTVIAIKKYNPETKVEVLIPDFQGKIELLKIILDSEPDVVGHNIETVSRLQKSVRPQAQYENSIDILKAIKQNGFITKTGVMVGLGESLDELYKEFENLSKIPIDILTIGQYLQPTAKHLAVDKYYTPTGFEDIKQYTKSIGIPHVEAGPLVRSSYHADEHLNR